MTDPDRREIVDEADRLYAQFSDGELPWGMWRKGYRRLQAEARKIGLRLRRDERGARLEPKK